MAWWPRFLPLQLRSHTGELKKAPAGCRSPFGISSASTSADGSESAAIFCKVSRPIAPGALGPKHHQSMSAHMQNQNTDAARE